MRATLCHTFQFFLEKCYAERVRKPTGGQLTLSALGQRSAGWPFLDLNTARDAKTATLFYLGSSIFSFRLILDT